MNPQLNRTIIQSKRVGNTTMSRKVCFISNGDSAWSDSIAKHLRVNRNRGYYAVKGGK